MLAFEATASQMYTKILSVSWQSSLALVKEKINVIKFGSGKFDKVST